MRKLHAAILLALGSVAAAGQTPGRGAEPTDFNQARLRAGQNLFEAKRYLEAIDQFRIAAFGFLDRPAALSETLARLALAQMAASRAEDADATIARYLDVERRFPSYPPASLASDLQNEFRALLVRRVAQGNLLAIPSLAGLVETEEQKIAKLAPAERRRAYEAAARREPSAIAWPLALARDALARSDAKEAEKWAEKAVSLEPSNPEAVGLRARARVQRSDLASARSDLAALPPSEFEKRPELYADLLVCLVEAQDWARAEDVAQRVPGSLSARPDVARAQQRLAAARPSAKAPAATASKPPSGPAASPGNSPPRPDPAATAARSRDALAESRRLVREGRAGEAQKLLEEALQGDPNNRDLRIALLEAACLSRAYREGAAQVALVTPFAETEAPAMFYAAVVLYETGKPDEARGYLKRAMPRVSGSLVEEYSRKILGSP